MRTPDQTKDAVPVKLHPALALLLLSTAACVAAPVETVATAPAAPVAAAPAVSEDARFNAFLDQAFEEQLALSPESQTSLGRKTNYDRLDRYTDEASAEAQALAEAQLARMKQEFDLDALSPQAQVSYRLFEYNVEQGRISQKWRSHRFPVTNTSSPAGNLPVFLINQHRVDSVADAEAYISRLREVERVMNEVADRVEAQAAQGIVPPRFVFEPVRADALRVISGAPFESGADSTLLADFRKKVSALEAPADVKARLIADATAALSGAVKRGYDRLLATMAEVQPKAAGNDGAWSLPNGAAFYNDQLLLQTTTPISADEVHRIGLAEVERIHREMRAIMARVGYTGTLQQFFQELKTDPKYQYPNTEEGRQAYLRDATGFVDQVMAAAPRWFNRLPKAALEVRAVEKWREATAPVAFYDSPAPDGSRPGIYYVNLSDMRQVLKPQIEAISYHEGAPGHHFQIAFAQELEGLPMFRRFGNYGAYAEGWGLYAERLGKEMGFYQDPYSDFGRLSTELWRAVRLVTDSGLHAKRWTREQAIDYFKQNSLLSERDIVKEVERYIVWPGQATSYKIGQLKILELRAKAQQALGADFDIREFHDVVLANGALPLSVLEQQVDAYIARKRS